ncbi:hypothetical protein NUU61_002810 [Penicillium alfredii]|uniref:Tyrosinase copper-binding domain-containing protein n=1 Tax=Penicillium alfredii TaxID=1506179 RepID=A0A9W9KHA6_9EURO|nr:uncharacterized protein NUU61_002810 [Penicillium alfredii]KAJ5105463.1 hypothetical protein NUU61_002810 [Penicillium alfredii]
MVAFKVLTLGLIVSQAYATFTLQKPSNAHLQGLPTSASPSWPAASHQLDLLHEAALRVANHTIGQDSVSHNRGTCTAKNLRVRRDWRAFSAPDKKAFIKSVRCLQQLPARTPKHVAPGARTRYDDFLATHINQTQQIHYTGTFLAWHRYFIFEFEQALRSECHYTGDYPYWVWGADAGGMEKSEVFDGSNTSMSGNGAYIPNQKHVKLLLGKYAPIDLPPGTGGGCVTSGPFKDYKVNMGPAALSLPGGNVSTSKNPLAYNPRCLKRSLTTELLQRYANYTSTVRLITENDNVWNFEMAMQGIPGSGSIGVHGGGHYSMGGDPGRDVYTSPGDPAFWHHHGMIDRVWWIWQNLDRKHRLHDISGTGTFMNNPPSPNTTLDTVIDIGHANGGPIAMRELMSTTDGPFCYVYI